MSDEPLGRLDPDRDPVVAIGRLEPETVHFWSNRANDDVVVTARQRAHYLDRHPEVAALEQAMVGAIADPDEVHRYRGNDGTANFYARLSKEKGGRYLLVSVAITFTEDRQNSVITVRLAREDELAKARSRG